MAQAVDETRGGGRERRKFAQAELRVVVFEMDGHEYVVDVAQVEEIVRVSGLVHMAGAPPYVAGVVKRRGRLVPVVDGPGSDEADLVGERIELV